MNIYNLPPSAGGDGAYQGSSGVWVTIDLTASFNGTTLTLGPNQINDASAYWYVGGGAAGAAGNKIMDANMYVQNDGLAGQTVIFAARTLTNTLAGTLPSWETTGVQPFTCVAFIKEFDASYNNLVRSTNVNLTTGTDFSITLATTAGDHVQYGFETVGPDIWPSDVGNVGKVILTPLETTAPSVSSNLLSNPGFESDAASENQTFPGWTIFGPNTYNETGAAAAHSGNNYLKIFQDFSAGHVNYSGIYQDYISGPGATYTADGWLYASSSDLLAGQNSAWVEITFRDANANILALYRSAIVTNLSGGTFPTDLWLDLPATNECNPATLQVTNTVSRLVAPPGTYFVRYQVTLRGDGNGSGGSVYFDDLKLLNTGNTPYGDWNIVWSDEFNGTNIDTTTWTYDTGNGGSNLGWGNNELEYYTTNNAYVANGLLHIVAQKESKNGFNYTSARLKSEDLFSLKYGRVEWRAKLPLGTGCWSALWLLGANFSDIGWPACGEIDVMENNGSNPSTIQSSLHSGSDETGYYNFINGDVAFGFHTYTLDWATNVILFYVDGHLFESQTNWSSSNGSYPFPFNQPFFFIMNLAIGGNYIGNPDINAINSGTSFPAEMQVDYVRVYNPTQPLKLSLIRTNNNLIVSWPSNIVGHLQAQFNPAGGLGTNWTDQMQYSNPAQLNPTNGSGFFRVESP